MTDAKQTKCPHCGSTFRISDAQLAARGGNVRCGSCLQVFRADQHLVAASAQPAAAPKPAAAAAPATAAKPKKNDESWAKNLIAEEGGSAEDWGTAGNEASDEFGFSADDIDSFISDGGTAPAMDEGTSGKSILFDDELSDQLEGLGDDAPLGGADEDSHRISANADESWAQDILSELQTEEQKTANQKYGMEILDEKSKPAPKNPKLAAALGMSTSGAETTAKPAAPPARTPPPKPTDDFLDEDADVLSFLDEDDLSSQPGSAAAPAATPAANPFSLERPLAHVDAPVELKTPRKPINWGYLLGWSFLCLVGLAMLVGQYVYFNFESLAVNPKVRPMFEDVCHQLGCSLPYVPDPSKIRVEELVVRKHPNAEGALVVDAIVKNSAPFTQPFPLLRLHFSNSSNELIASRVLRPLEYLQGEARLLRRMPPDTSMHISLEIVDPGKEAVVYGLEPTR